MSTDRLLVVQVAALSWELLHRHGHVRLGGLRWRPAESVFPALTCPVQASVRTAATPESHGMTANGRFFPSLSKVLFWEQAAALVQGERVWKPLREAGGTVGMYFWQQSLGEAVDSVLSPAPIHKHHGGMLPACYSRPDDLYARVQAAAGRPFRLHAYWGPRASVRASDWIADATSHVLNDASSAPSLCFTYLPGLDYDLQRFGPDDVHAERALAAVVRQLERVVIAARRAGYDVLVFGDYAIASCPRGAVYPNRVLAEAGLLKTRDVAGMQYLDLYSSKAFAVVDHEVAYVHVRDPESLSAARQSLATVAELMSPAERGAARETDAMGAVPDLALLASEGQWFAYPWWRESGHAPDFAGHVDIHNKPGFDPCELFWGWPPGSVSRNTDRVRGTHGRVGPGREVACAWSLGGDPPESLLDVGQHIARWSRAWG